MNSQAEPSNRVKSRIAGLLLACLVLVAMGVFNLPYAYVETNTVWAGGMEINTNHSQSQNVLPTMAGWPLRYSVRYEVDGQSQQRFWSAPRLITNLVIALSVACLVYGYIQLRAWRIDVARDRRLTQSLFDVSTSLAILILPTIILGWQYSVASQHRRLASQLQRYGNCQLSCWIPKPLVGHVPGGLVNSLTRLRQVQIFAPRQELVERTTQLPTLVAFHAYGGQYDTSSIKPLANNIHLAGLGLNGRSLSEADVDFVAQLRWLVHLSMNRSSLDAEMLRRLDDMQGLKIVDLSRTNFELSELGSPSWSATAEQLYLSRPLTGNGGSLQIDNWPQLQQLRIRRLSTDLNDLTLRVRLSNLPSLEILRLDRNQKHDLFLKNLPRLSVIDEGVSNLQRIMDQNQMIPGLTWVCRFHAEGVASLPQISCFARDLEEFSVGDAIGLKSITLGSYLISAMGYQRPQPADPERCQEWLYELGDRIGPSTVDLSDLPIGHADLSPLLGNSRIRRLGLRNCGVSFDQIKQLGPMKQIEYLDISSCRLKADQLTWILEQLPKLEYLSIDGAGLSRFDLTANDQLKRISTSVLKDATEIRIVDRPSVETFLTASRAPEILEIRNAHSLKGLALQGPWPKNAVVSGLRDLEWFAGGGKEIGDDLLDVLLACGKLDQLTLAYTSVSRQKAIEIGDFHHLTLLAVPGMNVDDEITAEWHKIKSLWEANFDDTSVSFGTIAWLSGIKSLRRLSLNRVQLSNDAADVLSNIRQVCELRLVDVPIETRKLKRLLEYSNIESLDLSGRDVDDELVDAVIGSAALKHLVLHDSKIDAESLNRILEANPIIYVELGQIPEFADDKLLADLYRRARNVRNEFNTGWRQVFLSMDDGDSGWDNKLRLGREKAETQMISLVEPPRTGTIMTQLFRPSHRRDDSSD